MQSAEFPIISNHAAGISHCVMRADVGVQTWIRLLWRLDITRNIRSWQVSEGSVALEGIFQIAYSAGHRNGA
jgi:hypothetical protein